MAAVQLARLAGECLFITALGDDALGHRAKRELEALGLRVEAVWRPEAQRRAIVHVDGSAERTITVIGERMGPSGNDPLPWAELGAAVGRAEVVHAALGPGRLAERMLCDMERLSGFRAPAPDEGVAHQVTMESEGTSGPV